MVCTKELLNYLPLLRASGDLSRKRYDAEGSPLFILHKVVFGIGACGSRVYRLYSPLLAIIAVHQISHFFNSDTYVQVGGDIKIWEGPNMRMRVPSAVVCSCHFFRKLERKHKELFVRDCTLTHC